jgi:hypothetical protein
MDGFSLAFGLNSASALDSFFAEYFDLEKKEAKESESEPRQDLSLIELCEWENETRKKGLA